MTKQRYTITEAADILRLRTHTLRYWEEELELQIPRNEMGHRVYYQEQIEQFQTIRVLKEQGYQLTAIRMQLQEKFPYPSEGEKEYGTEEYQPPEPVASNRGTVKLEQFQILMNEVVKQAMIENNSLICNQVEERILKEMNYLIREQDEQARERYLQLDQTIRQLMQGKTMGKVRKFSHEKKDIPDKKSGKTLGFGRKKEVATKCDRITGTL